MKYLKINDRDWKLIEKIYYNNKDEFSYLKNPKELADELLSRAMIQAMDNLNMDSDIE